jgi:protein involved in polysaccharide export with SLBB domain
MTKKSFLPVFTFFFIFIYFTLIFSNTSPAQQIQALPIPPQYQVSPEPVLPTQPLQRQPSVFPQPKPQAPQVTPVQQPWIQPPIEEEKLSEFEQYISGKAIEINESQFGILKKFEGITFQYTAKNLPLDKIAIAVKVVKEEESPSQQIIKIEPLIKPVVVDAGYLVSTPEVLVNAFNILGIKSPLAVTTDIRQFGYGLFRLSPSTFAPVDSVPVGPEYVLGPGDEIRITVWGKIEGLWNLVIDRDGNISIPKVGTIGVTGLTFRELKEALHKEFSKYFTGFEMNVSMGALRTISVYVVGNANRPGAYTISSLSTLINALFEAGGPGKNGTMRDIQLKRNGKIIVNFDLYDFLLKGDKTKDIRLMPEDVIFIPSVGPLVGIAGSVNNPAIYELKGEITISQLIEMAGGLSDIAFSGRVQIERIIDNTRQIVFDDDLDKVKDVTVQSGDSVKIFPVVQDKRVVRLSGAVQREGEYGFKPGMTVRDLILMAGGLKYYAYNKEAELTRVYVTDRGPETEKIIIEPEKAMAGDPEDNILLKEEDYLFIRTIPEWKLYQTVTISGEVNFPGTYTIKKGERLSSLIERAGRFTDKAYLRGTLFTRERVRDLQQRQLDEMVERLERELLGAGAAEIATAISPEEARIKEFEIRQKKEFVAKLRTVKVKGRMVLKITEPEKLKNTSYDIELEEGDSLFVPTNPMTVQVIGSVYNQTAFIYERSKGYKHYIDLAGGYTENADDDNVYMLKIDGTAVKLGGGLFSFARNVQVESGDTIVVPEELEKIAWMREIKDLSQILYQIAVTAGVLIVAF